jgi:hypothetical protein
MKTLMEGVLPFQKLITVWRSANLKSSSHLWNGSILPFTEVNRRSFSEAGKLSPYALTIPSVRQNNLCQISEKRHFTRNTIHRLREEKQRRPTKRMNKNFDAETIRTKINLVTVPRAAWMIVAGWVCQLCSLYFSLFILIPFNQIVSTAMNTGDEWVDKNDWSCTAASRQSDSGAVRSAVLKSALKEL